MRRLLIGFHLGAASLAFASTGHATSGPPAPERLGANVGTNDESLARAQRAFAEGRRLLVTEPVRARAELIAATESAPAFAPPWYALAMLERRAGRHAEAIVAYQRYVGLAPTDVEPLFGMGLSQQAVGKTAEARATLTRFVAEATDPALAPFVARARALLTTLPSPLAPRAPSVSRPEESALLKARQERADGRAEQALTLYRQALAAHAAEPAVVLEIGEAFMSAARWEEARATLLQATQLSPTPPEALYDLAVVERQLQHDAEAARAYRTYLGARPSDPDAYYGLAAALAASGDRAGAAEALRTYLRLETRPEEARWVARAQRRLDALEGRR